MATPMLVNLSSLLDDAKCLELVRHHRWPDGVRCPRCHGATIARDGHDDTQRHQQRYRCKTCKRRFDDLTGTVLAGHHRNCLHGRAAGVVAFPRNRRMNT